MQRDGRDADPQLSGWIKTDRWEHTYAVMVGTGSGLAIYNGTGSGTPDWYLYWSSERLFGGKGPLREGFKLTGWYQAEQAVCRHPGTACIQRQGLPSYRS